MSLLSEKLPAYLTTKLTGFKHEFNPNPKHHIEVLTETKEKVEEVLSQQKTDYTSESELINSVFQDAPFFHLLDDPLQLKHGYVGIHKDMNFSREILVKEFNFLAPKKHKKRRSPQNLPPLKYKGELHYIPEVITGIELYKILANINREEELIRLGIDVRHEKQTDVILSIPKQLFQEIDPNLDPYTKTYIKYFHTLEFMKVTLTGDISATAISTDYSNPVEELNTIITTYSPLVEDLDSLHSTLATYHDVYQGLSKQSIFYPALSSSQPQEQLWFYEATSRNLNYIYSQNIEDCLSILSISDTTSFDAAHSYISDNLLSFENWQHLTQPKLNELLVNSPFTLPEYFIHYLNLFEQLRDQSDYFNISQISSQLEEAASQIDEWVSKLPQFLSQAEETLEIKNICKDLLDLDDFFEELSHMLQNEKEINEIKIHNKLAQLQKKFLEELESSLTVWKEKLNSSIFNDINRIKYKDVPNLKTKPEMESNIISLTEIENTIFTFLQTHIDCENLNNSIPNLPSTYQEFEELNFFEIFSTTKLTFRNYIYLNYIFRQLPVETIKPRFYEEVIKNPPKIDSNNLNSIELKNEEQTKEDIIVHNLKLTENRPLDIREIKDFLSHLEASFIPGKSGHDCYRIQLDENSTYTYTISISTVHENKYFANFLLKDLRTDLKGELRTISQEFYQKLKEAFSSIGIDLIN